MAVNTDKKQGKFICTYCGDTYTREALFNKHIKDCEDNPSNGGNPDENINADLMATKKDPSQMTEIEKLEHELVLKKREAAKLEADKKTAEVLKSNGLDIKGLMAEPDNCGKFRLIQVRNHAKLHVVFNEQDEAGFDYLDGFSFSTGVLFLIFKKHGA